MPDISEYLTTEQVADLLGYNVEYVRRMIRKDKLPAEKLAGVWLVHRDAAKEYQEAVKGLDKNDPRRGDLL